MRLATYRSDRGPRAGVLSGDEVVDVGPGVRALLEGGGLEGLDDADGDRLPLNQAELLPPVPDPDKIICLGLNYRAHAEEAGLDPPDSPTFFAKFRNALAGPGETVELPPSLDLTPVEQLGQNLVALQRKTLPVPKRPRGRKIEAAQEPPASSNSGARSRAQARPRDATCCQSFHGG